MQKFTVYGDYGYTSQCELFSCNGQNEAIRWALQYIRDGFGGYNTITVSYLDHRTNWVETVLTLGADGSVSYEEDYSEQSAISYNL